MTTAAIAPPPERDRLLWAAGAMVIASALAVYGRGLGAGFVGDDVMILHRLRALGGPADVFGFFRGEFFEYYRPLGFISHAFDWSIAGADPAQFHRTSLLLHVVNALLVLALGWRLAPGTLAGPAAALLFALHAAHHEAVIWISARFDLLATAFSLTALLLMVRGRAIAAASAFLLALLSKESAVALPLAAAAWAVFGLRKDRRTAAISLAPWLAALAAYAMLRALGGGVSAVGGAGRLPKLIALAIGLVVVVALAGDRWVPIADWMRRRLGPLAGGLLALLAAGGLIVLAPTGAIGTLVAEKLAVAGFVIANLALPVSVHAAVPFYLDPEPVWYWLGGLLALSGVVALLPLVGDRMLGDPRLLFLSALLAATLLPISALTEGTRYLYLPSAPLMLMIGILAAGAGAAPRKALLVIGAGVLVVSSAQIAVKAGDWVWAGRMTAEGARLVDDSLAPSCGDGHVVFLTSPVAVRGVYTHFYYETFELPRGCRPETFHVVARLLRRDAAVDAGWVGPRRIRFVLAHGADLVFSEDFRWFDRRVRDAAGAAFATPLGAVTVSAEDSRHVVQVDLARDVDPAAVRFFYYSDGRIRRLEQPAIAP
jgi:hypothetical protein